MCQINPMSEIRAIAETCRRKCLPANARLLWRVLFDCANDRQVRDTANNTYHWPDGFFPICNDELKANSALEKRAILEAREVLKENGLIDFIPGENNRRPARYKIHYLTSGRYKNVPGYGTAEDTVHSTAVIPAYDTAHVPIYKDIDTRYSTEKYVDDEDVNDVNCARAEEYDDPITDRTERTKQIREDFRCYFGRHPNPLELERLVFNSWRFKLSAEMVGKALREAAANNAKSPLAYTLAVLGEWRRMEVRTPEQLEEYQVQYLLYESDSVFARHFRPMEREEFWGARERRRQENIEAGIIED